MNTRRPGPRAWGVATLALLLLAAMPGATGGTASGRATYGYHHGYGYAYHPHGYGGWHVGMAWGWPYDYGAYYPAPYFYPAVVRVGPPAVETDIRPKKARVYLDGEPVGLAKDYNGTWDELPLEPGRRVLRFEAEGYRTLTVEVTARAGNLYRIAYDLEKGEGEDARSSRPEARTEPPRLRKGLLRFEVEPQDAAVYLDGAFLARGDELSALHGAIPVAGGEHRIEAVRPGFRSAAVTVQVEEGEPQTVRLTLEPDED